MKKILHFLPLPFFTEPDTTQLQAHKFHFQFNPFSGLKEEELAEVLVPHEQWEEIVALAQSGENLVIELQGAKGRGKTSHLRLLHQLFPQAPLFPLPLPDTSSLFTPTPASLILVDSIHHLSIKQRIKLYRQTQTLVLTTHSTRRWEYQWAGKSFRCFKFRGIQAAKLKSILEKRLQLASYPRKEKINIELQVVQELIHYFGDDYRGIINHLYRQFQT